MVLLCCWGLGAGSECLKEYRRCVTWSGSDKWEGDGLWKMGESWSELESFCWSSAAVFDCLGASLVGSGEEGSWVSVERSGEWCLTAGGLSEGGRKELRPRVRAHAFLCGYHLPDIETKDNASLPCLRLKLDHCVRHPNRDACLTPCSEAELSSASIITSNGSSDASRTSPLLPALLFLLLPLLAFQS